MSPLLSNPSPTILQLLMQGQPLIEGDRRLPAVLPFKGEESCVCVGFDHGNSAAKLATLNAGSEVITKRIPAAYKNAEEVSGGERIVTYQVDDGTPFWIGDIAIQYEGESLHVGSTSIRLNDLRQREFNAAAIVELLRAAGHTPGEHKLALGFAIPNYEMQLQTVDGSDEEKLDVVPATREAIKRWVKNKTYVVKRTDERGNTAVWTLQYRQVAPQAQSVGTYLVWSKTVSGKTVTNGINTLTVLDLGGGDSQRTTISIKPYTIVTRSLGSGTVIMAQALRERLPKLITTDIQAQEALMTRSVQIGGRKRDISDEITKVLNTHGSGVLGRMLTTLKDLRQFIILIGGGTILLRKEILALADQAERRILDLTHPEQQMLQDVDTVLLNPELSTMLNAIGALLGIMYASVRKARV